MKTILEIKEKMKAGDLETAAKMTGITPSNGSKALNRPGSKYHNSIIECLGKVIDTREMLISSNQ